ncbi:MAG: ATP-binding cassette domain-containing protein, partial [Defluviitoga tunisiensis]
RGSKLSDGQRERVAIARALIRNPKVLILDEATSGVDSQTEEEIFEELKEYDMTLIIISHRLSTIRKADKVVVLKDGEIIGEGTHNELIESSPVYKEIIESQLVV